MTGETQTTTSADGTTIAYQAYGAGPAIVIVGGATNRKEDWVELYAKPYYFGCEADDRMNAVAFGKGNPFGAQLNAIYSSDIGHFDVVDMRDPLPEAFELVEDGHITESDFQDFVFGNAVRLWGTQNPRFFEGTAVAKEAAALLKRGAPTPRDAAK